MLQANGDQPGECLSVCYDLQGLIMNSEQSRAITTSYKQLLRMRFL